MASLSWCSGPNTGYGDDGFMSLYDFVLFTSPCLGVGDVPYPTQIDGYALQVVSMSPHWQNVDGSATLREMSEIGSCF